MMRIILIALLSLTLANCSKTMTGKNKASKVYKVKEEAKIADGRILNKVPQWFIDAQVEKGLITNRDAENFIYAVGSGESPDLQMAMDKAILVAKASLADQLEGMLNKRSNYFTTEHGKEGNKKVASTIDQTTVNIIKDTKVRGYEEWHKAVFETPKNTYRVYIGLKFGVGDANRLAEYIEDNGVAPVDVAALAKEATDDLVAVPVETVTEVD
jgi:hypothetical protein|tara:strand:+ start:118 stop:756 length:639 start_codon:yes stop_codon:yes gene_type:complete